LQSIDPTGGPTHPRGLPIRSQDTTVRRAIDGLHGEVDADAVTNAWNRIMTVSDYDGPPVWYHGDLVYLNLLAQHGKLTAVIDWGTCGVGDPTIETRVAWTLFPPEVRAEYRAALGVDDATWQRGKGWILTGVYGISYYRDTNPTLVANIVQAIEAVLADPE
jgi:aminoglycoside phosphotransferase (APT) family kinase protein